MFAAETEATALGRPAREWKLLTSRASLSQALKARAFLALRSVLGAFERVMEVKIMVFPNASFQKTDPNWITNKTCQFGHMKFELDFGFCTRQRVQHALVETLLG